MREDGLGSRIRSARQALGLTQADLAIQVGVSRGAVAQWETGRSGQLGRHLAKVGAALGVGADYLLGRQGGDAPSGALDEAKSLVLGTLTADELALLRLYRTCSPEDQQVILRLSRRLSVQTDTGEKDT